MPRSMLVPVLDSIRVRNRASLPKHLESESVSGANVQLQDSHNALRAERGACVEGQ